MSKMILKRFSSLMEAKAAEMTLQAAGIPALVDNEAHGSMIPHYSNALGGFTLSVDSEKAEEASSLLEADGAPAEPTSQTAGAAGSRLR